MTDDELIAGFESGSLPNESFHHTDHVRMAFLHVRRYPALEAIQRFSSALARFTAANGKPQLYNETVTWPAPDPRKNSPRGARSNVE